MQKFVPLLLCALASSPGYCRDQNHNGPTPQQKAQIAQQTKLAWQNLQKAQLQLKQARLEVAYARQQARQAQLEAERTHLQNLRAQAELIQTQSLLEEGNKKLVLTFYQRFFGDKDITAADQYLAPSYIQHNPFAATGRDAVKKFFTPFFANPAIPKSKIDVRHVAADGDLVWLHIRSKTTGAESAVVDIFRVKDGKIVEHWDVVQPVPAKSANNNTMF